MGVRSDRFAIARLCCMRMKCRGVAGEGRARAPLRRGLQATADQHLSRPPRPRAPATTASSSVERARIPPCRRPARRSIGDHVPSSPSAHPPRERGRPISSRATSPRFGVAELSGAGVEATSRCVRVRARCVVHDDPRSTRKPEHISLMAVVGAVTRRYQQHRRRGTPSRSRFPSGTRERPLRHRLEPVEHSGSTSSWVTTTPRTTSTPRPPARAASRPWAAPGSTRPREHDPRASTQDIAKPLRGSTHQPAHGCNRQAVPAAHDCEPGPRRHARDPAYIWREPPAYLATTPHPTPSPTGARRGTTRRAQR